MKRPSSGPEPLSFSSPGRVPGILALVSALPLIYGLALSGCGGSQEEHRSLVAANERVNDLLKENARLEETVKALQTQLTRRETELAAKHEKELVSLKQELEDRQARRHQLSDEKVAQLENVIAGLRLELGAVQREKLVLQDLVDRAPRIADVKRARSTMIDAVLGIFGGLTLIVLIVVGARYRVLRHRHDLLVVQRAASLQPRGGMS